MQPLTEDDELVVACTPPGDRPFPVENPEVYPDDWSGEEVVVRADSPKVLGFLATLTATTALLHGSVRRPPGSDSYWPPVGTLVNWTVVQPIQNLYDQAKGFGWVIAGVIGNQMHLQKHGDHTPWSAGKKRGRVYAIDIHAPVGFEPWLVAMCKSEYNTTWIDFFNINNKQFDNAGNYLGYSGDTHLHVSVANGQENTIVSLFADFMNPQEDEVSFKDKVNIPASPVGPLPDAARQGMDSADDVIGYTRREVSDLHKEVKKLQESVVALTALVKSGAPDPVAWGKAAAKAQAEAYRAMLEQ